MKTSKKVKTIGKEQYINKSTGEVEEFNVISIQDKDFNFEKIWLSHLISSIDVLTNKKTKIALYILENKINSENIFFGTIRSIAKETKTSINTVKDTLKILRINNLISIAQQGVYRVNPDIIFKGSNQQRLNILQKYIKEKE